MLLPPPPRRDRMSITGKGGRLLDLALRHAPEKQWAQWLRLPLTGAALDGDVATVRDLIAAGADASAGARESDGSTLLHVAAQGGSASIVEALLSAGAAAGVNQPKLTGDLQYPLHIAAKHGHVGVAAALIEAGAAVSCRDKNKWTPLHLAARFGQIEVVIELLRAGADRDAEDVNGYRPLHYATMWSQPSTTKTLLNAGASIESITRVDGLRPLHIAARYGSALVVRELLGQGAEKNAKNSRGFTALHAAAASNRVQAMRLLLAAGADIDVASEHQRFTALHLAARRGAVESAAALLEAGAAIDARTADSSTPLHLACTLLKAETARLLLDHGADEAAVNVVGQTPATVTALFLAERDRDEVQEADIRNRLARAGADRTWRRRGWIVMARARLQQALRAADGSETGRDGAGFGDNGACHAARASNSSTNSVTRRHAADSPVADAGAYDERKHKSPRREDTILAGSCQSHAPRVIASPKNVCRERAYDGVKDAIPLRTTPRPSRARLAPRNPHESSGDEGVSNHVASMVARLEEDGLFQAIVTFM